MAQITRFYPYKLDDPEGPVEVSITIGNAQSASTDIYLNSKLIKNQLRDSFSDEPIEDQGDLTGKEMDISTTIFDINPDSNKIYYELKITGGQKDLTPPADEFTVPEQGIANFIIKVIFI